ncbi:plasmid replication/partition related protein [Streptomyces sp. NPDC056773]|uniref:plasmid replication/partition related protein n=1 Tax=unclassified Streptomyces TaxID=2593676 RepID=UPI00368BBEEE
MVDEEELLALAEDISAIGLQHPIVLDDGGRVLDGRNRLKACEIAGVEPRFTTYEGSNPNAHAFSVNARRRNITKGQLALIAAQASVYGVNPHGFTEESLPGFTEENSGRTLSEKAGVSGSRISQAFTVLRHAPELADSVISGAMGLNEAYKTAREAKNQADSAESQLTRLRAEDPELADRVVEGELTLTGAWAERKARKEEEIRQRKVATQFLCEVVPPLAQARGTNTAGKFDPEFVLPGRSITQEVIENAMTALTEMAATLRERDLA